MGSLVCLMVSTILAGVRMRRWIPIVVAAGASAAALSQHLDLDSRIAAVAHGASEIQRLLVHWEALSVMDRRAPKVRERMAKFGEQAFHGVMFAWTRDSRVVAVDEPSGQTGKGDEMML